MIDDQARHGSTPRETFRATVEGHTPSGDSATVIITRQGLGIDARVWLTFDGAIKTTTVLTDRELAELRKLLADATDRRFTP